MSAVYEIAKLLDMIKEEKSKCYEELEDLTYMETFWKRYTYSKLICKGKIEALNMIEKKLKEDLRKAVLMNEAEL